MACNETDHKSVMLFIVRPVYSRDNSGDYDEAFLV
jgi:hypothetical protein